MGPFHIERYKDDIFNRPKASQRVQLQTLRAPIDGTIQQLSVHTLGCVVTPAQTALVVVPDHPGLIVEAQVENRDVGFVHAGQKAEIKVEAFTYTRYGLVHGEVISVSRDAVSADPERQPERDVGHKARDEDQAEQAADEAPRYTVAIKLDRTVIETEDGSVSLGPGMQVQAEVRTGRRRVAEYLLSAMWKTTSTAMRER